MNYTELKTVIKFCHISKQYIGDPIWWKRTVIPISLTFGILKYFVHSFNFQTKLKIQLFKKSRLGSISDVYPTFPRALLDKVSLFHILLIRLFNTVLSFPSGSGGKESAYNAGDPGLIPGSGRAPGEGNGYPLQCSCLENSMDRGTWQCTGSIMPTRLSSVTPVK